LEALLGAQQTQAILARETVSFPGRLGIQHRDVIHAVAVRAADVGIIFHHLALCYATAYPEICTMVPVLEASQFSSTIAMVPASDPLRATAAKAFSKFFLGAARDIYPRHGFATMSSTEYCARIQLS
jgi:hypothetical protein